MSSDEWEYEYSSHETESLYFTLDLTTHVPNAISDTQVITSGHPSKNHSAPRADPSNRGHQDSEDEDEDEDGEDLPGLQILDLHTSNPLIKFEESVYSCYWTTDLGTQFHIAAAGETSEPLRKGTVLDVIGISRARLLGKPVGLIDRNAPPVSSTATKAGSEQAAEALEEEDCEEDDTSLTTTTGPLKIPRSILQTPTSRSQATFLEKFSLIKQAKGEMDQVPIIAVKQYVKPSNAEDIKRDAENYDMNHALVNGVDGKKRRRRRPMGVRPRNRGGAGRPGRERIEKGLGLEGTQGHWDVVEDRAEMGMFGPDIPRRNEGLTAGYSTDAQFIDDGEEVEEGDENPGRMERLIEMPGVDSTADEEGENSAPWRPNPQAEDGYLSFQTRAEYLDNVRSEGSATTPARPLRPMRPPWMGNDEDRDAHFDQDDTATGGMDVDKSDQ